ncbi:glycoside hydrolase family 2 TIM barrel-domain containing protein [Coraliomargarita sp. SDUM461004]|uniref:Glycoside hydrolase family 2 TIM barrel-domain containing protein n=1 Tax=Thalassobacterium sedimentorum TaxID=3041258 RepID=A0ABU1AE42_9BACT|nr:glycoside hydrolase family 2 TIM barrel-domain containing protein [Coraliomargarita sp. SDUM461004]MDQ8192960.1 glycoside hydrolase family 2 TIM barrel-domain containing protein [Coraliomargarita sp. SDUM461004]
MLKKRDIFADIATGSALAPREGLYQPNAPMPNLRRLNLSGAPVEIPRVRKMTTHDELLAALETERERTQPFMQDLAPKLPGLRCQHVFESCDWRVKTAEDVADFAAAEQGAGDWETVQIPHYGPPLGKASTLYRVEFDAPEELYGLPSHFLCFKAVDYSCLVYLNGVCLGGHEGIFEPFEFDVHGVLKAVGNVLLVQVDNDFTMLGQAFEEGQADGDKVYAATGLGYDDPQTGWHHCPPGMGIWQPFYLEGRSIIAITDLFVRPSSELDSVEICVEVSNAGEGHEEVVSLRLGIWGQNFEAKVCSGYLYYPTTVPEGGFGDLDKELPSESPLLVGSGKNYFSFTVPIENAKLWHPDSPWLYQAQLELLDEQGVVLDSSVRQFGMRTFVQSEESNPKGKFYLNGEEIRLRGANTMGNIDMCVFRGDYDQLADDILLARLTNMNFLRLTQHPVQQEVYDYCDRLGMMLQTDLPLFASIRKNQFWECVRQAGAMEKLVRSHPSNILVSFINEPMPNGRGRPHRFIDREDMQLFFEMATGAVRRENPDRVIKCVDGDYDPPAKLGMPDNHCYCGWYLGHGIDLGRLHAGYWLPVKEGWHFGCGEFGAEGLDSFEVMSQFYPEDWGATALNKVWNPGGIPQAQTMNFHWLWYSTPETVAEWIDASQQHQDWVNQLMTASFRRMDGMNTFAIHLFIDAWPAGWMKTIMDVNRIPKKSWFTYRDLLSPVIVSLRADRMTGFCDEEIPVDLWVSNDTNEDLDGATLMYQVAYDGTILASGQQAATIRRCAPDAQGQIMVTLPNVDCVGSVQVSAVLVDASGQAVHDCDLQIGVFPREVEAAKSVCVFSDDSQWNDFVESLGLQVYPEDSLEEADAILVTTESLGDCQSARIMQAVQAGATAVYLSMSPGQYEIGQSEVSITKAGMGPRHFASCGTAAEIVADFSDVDFKFWYDESCGYVTPLLTTVMELDPDWQPVLESGDGGWGRPWRAVPVAAERPDGLGVWRICQVSLLNRVQTNPVARRFARRLFLGVQS